MSDQIELKDVARDWYFNNPNSHLSDVSEKFGIPKDTVVTWNHRENWTARRRGMIQLTDDVREQASDIRRVLYEKITTNELAADDLSELVKAWKSMAELSAQTDDQEYIDRDDLMELLDETD